MTQAQERTGVRRTRMRGVAAAAGLALLGCGASCSGNNTAGQMALKTETAARPSGSSWDGTPTPSATPTAKPEPAPSDTTPQGMVLVPAGKFWMGCAPSDTNCGADEKPRHEVYVSAFYIDKTEVTVGAYKSCSGCTASLGYGAGGAWEKHCNLFQSGKDDHPVDCVGWLQASNYCQHLGKRLPTEAEWEKAARGTSGNLYPWGSGSPDGKACWKRRGQKLGTCPVGSFPADKSPYGALDMAGNVREWTSDWYDAKYYASSPARDPYGGAGGSSRVNRGGSWYVDNAGHLRASNRASNPPLLRLFHLGFRCARPAPRAL